MITKLSLGLVLLGAMAAGAVSLNSSSAPAAKSGCCNQGVCSTNVGSEGCPDCKSEKDCGTDCTKDRNSQCDAEPSAVGQDF